MIRIPIDVSWRSMFLGMRTTYCAGKKLTREYKFADGKKSRICAKGASVFFATVTKMVGKGGETKPRPKKVTQEAFMEAAQEYCEEMILFMEATLQSSDTGLPRWILFARKILKSKKIKGKLKAYWRKRLAAWEKKQKRNKK